MTRYLIWQEHEGLSHVRMIDAANPKAAIKAAEKEIRNQGTYKCYSLADPILTILYENRMIEQKGN